MDDQGITKFIQLADDSAQVPKLRKKRYGDYKLTPDEWTNLDLLHQVLKVLTLSLISRHPLLTLQMQHPALAQQQFSSEHLPTVSHMFPTIEFLLTLLEARYESTTRIARLERLRISGIQVSAS
jgi:hypothetical protein